MDRTYREILKSSRLYPVLVLEYHISHRQRRWLLRFNQVILLLAFFVAGLYWWSGAVFNLPLIAGLSALYLAWILVLELLDIYFRAYYFGSIISNEYQPTDLFTFTVGRIIYRAALTGDILRGFLASEVGRQMMRRAGIAEEEWRGFLERRHVPPPLNLLSRSGEVLRLRQLIDLLLAADPDWSAFLFRHGIKPLDFLAIADWVVREIELEAIAERWWSRDNLARVPSLGADWSYGVGYFLRRFSRDLLTEPAARPSPLALSRPRPPEVEQMEAALLRSSEANVLLVGEAGQAKMELIWQLAREINGRRAQASLLGQRLIMLNTVLLLSTITDSASLETTLTSLLTDASLAGNIILVIDNLAALARAADGYNVNLGNVLDPFLSTANLPVIALADTDEYPQVLEPRVVLTRRFELVQVTAPDPAVLLAIIEDEAVTLEKRYPITFTYPALREVALAAERYFQTEAVSDQAIDLLVGVIPIALSQGKKIISQALIWNYVEQKTGIPLGEVTMTERETLTKLEELLAAKVIGQSEAVRVVASAIKRNRAGVRNPRRPAGSFLFLGPTGVGKTETAKALATILFGQPEALLRLDMSEYQGAEALTRLIGSYGGNKPGLLANLVREHPYGVLLLDEFEKTSLEARNLFLQILDEGFFSDAAGRKINARNLVFIATSNAGAELIWELTQVASIDHGTLKTKLINHLVAHQLFKPELLNRFDGIVVFKPLGGQALRQIARLMLGKLAERLREQNLELVVDEALVDQIARGGYNNQFGARPMNRYLQETIEQAVANQLIFGTIKAGDRITFNNNQVQTITG